MSMVIREEEKQEGPLSAQETDVKQAPDPEVEPKVQRRRFTAAYKAKVVAQADACAPGELGALLRREGLYYSSIQRWRRQRDEGTLAGLAPKRRGPAPDIDKDLKRRYAKLEKENQRLQKRLADAELIIDVQKKLSLLLNQTKETTEPVGDDRK